MSKVIVLLSGGMDSTTCLAKAVNEHGAGNVLALTLYYGQKHSIELKSAEMVSEYYDIEHKVVKLPDIFAGYGSTLMDADCPNPVASYKDISDAKGVSPTYVPFRNANFLSVATAMALVEGAELIYYGPHAEDAANWAYPDCTPEFNGAMANAIYVGSYHKVRLVTPLQWCTKADVVQIAVDQAAPLELSYSCYNGRVQHCGVCPTCIGRIQAFQDRGLIDPVPYEIEIDWLGCEPW